MSREKNLIKNTAIFMVGNFASRFLGFILLPLYTHYLAPEDFGYYELVIATISIIIPVITLQINDAMYRYLLDTDNDKEAGRIITSSFTVTIAGIFACCVIFSILLNFMSIPFSFPIFAYLVTLILSGLWQLIARGLKKNVVYTVSGVLFTAVTLLSNILLIIFLGMKLEALFYSNIAASLTVVAYIEFKLKILRKLSWRGTKGDTAKTAPAPGAIRRLAAAVDMPFIKKLAAYSVPLLPNALNWWIISTCNRYIIDFYLGTSAFGIFAVSLKFPSLLTALNSVFYMAWQESAIREYEAKDKDAFYTRMFNFYMKFQFCTMLVLLPVTRWGMLLVVEKRYMDAWMYVPFLYAGTIFMSFATFYGTGYLSSKDTKGAFTTSITGAAANVALNFALMPVMGMQAASLSNMLAFAGLWILRVYQTRKYFSIKVDLKSLISLILITGIYIVFYYFNNLILDVIMTVLSLGLFYLFNRSLVEKAAGLLRNRLASVKQVRMEGDKP